MNCCNSAKEVTRLQKELKLWKERYFVEKKCRKLIESYTLSAFGFDLRVEYDKNTSTVKIQGTENKEMMKSAVLPNKSQDPELRVLVMEVTLENNDFFEDGDDIIPLPPVQIEVESNQIIMNTTSTGKIGQLLGNSTKGQQVISTTNFVSNSAVVNQQQHIQATTTGAFEISSPPAAGGSEIYYIGNYDDGSGTGEKIFIFSKPEENEEIPIQFDYPQFVNGDVGSSSEKQVYYRIATPEPPPQSESPVYEIVQTTPTPTPTTKLAKKRKPSTPKNTSSRPNSKKPNTSKVSNKTIILEAETEDDPANSTPIVIAVTTAPPPFEAPQLKQDSYQVNIKRESEEKPNNSRNPLSVEFGLTLRERAEIYVRTKAKESIRKVGSGYECILCPDARYFYSCLENAITHTKGHFDGKPYKCEQCEETFGVQRELLRHRKALHPKNKGPPAKPTSLHSIGQPLHQIPPTGKGTATAVVVTTSIPTGHVKKQITNAGARTTNKSAPPLNHSKNQYKCQVEGCEWSYSSEIQLGWHMKAHSQARV